MSERTARDGLSPVAVAVAAAVTLLIVVLFAL